MQHILILLAGLVLSDASRLKPPPTPPKKEYQSLAGIYKVKGLASSGYYYGSAIIRHPEEKILQIRWSNVASSTYGIGIVHKNSISVTWKTDKGVLGSTVYTVEGKSLKGVWSEMDDLMRVTDPTYEELTFLSKLEDEEL